MQPPRRPLAARQSTWAQALARALTRRGVAPNAISVTSLAFSIVAAIALEQSGAAIGLARATLLIVSAVCIQLRLLCNLLDGMVAIEGGRRTPYGEIFNDMPDRFADLAILVAAGYAIPAISFGAELGWVAGVLAVLTAYVRLLGGSMGAQQYFVGPMAKQQRMAVITAACVLSTLEPLAGWHGQVLACALVIVIVGSIVTLVRRTAKIVAEVNSR